LEASGFAATTKCVKLVNTPLVTRNVYVYKWMSEGRIVAVLVYFQICGVDSLLGSL
jgi:hypothetical protein